MPGASSNLNLSLDKFFDGAYDPAIADAVNALERGCGLVPPSSTTATLGFGTAGVIGQSLDDGLITTTLLLTTGTVQATLVELTAGQVVTNVNLLSGAASATQTHGWVAITSASAQTVLAVSADAGSTVTLASQVQKVALAAPWTVPTTGPYYVHVAYVASGTMPTFDAAVAVGGLRATLVPIIAGTGSTSVTTPPAVGGTLSITLTATKALAIYLN